MNTSTRTGFNKSAIEIIVVEDGPGYWRGKKLSKMFDNFILLLIILSSLSLAL
jgi:hypothetical protein